MTKLAPEWVRTNDPVIRSPARYRWSTAPAYRVHGRNKSTSRKEPLVFRHRPIGSEQVTKMRHELSNICWSELFHDEYVDRSNGIFIDKLRNVIDTCAPEKTTTTPHKSVVREPWMTSGII